MQQCMGATRHEIGPDQAAGIAAVSMDMGPAYAKSVRADGHAPAGDHLL